MLVNLNDVLRPAMKGKYAVGLFNTIDTDMLQAAIDAAEEMRSPIIIGTAEVLLPSGELHLIAPSVIAQAKRASVPVVVHFDHGLTFDRCMEALKLGFTSVMYDGSAKDYETNISETREIVKVAHAFGATVEGEIGHVGTIGEDADFDSHTTVQEAIDYLDATGVDALAIAVGTAHGTYKSKPKLAFERISEIRSAVEAPLVLHGASGLTDEDFSGAIACGIAKMNIYTDLCVAGIQAMAAAIGENLPYTEIRDRKMEAIKQAVKRKLLLFGSVGKA